MTSSSGARPQLTDPKEARALDANWDKISDEEALGRLEEINEEMVRRLEQVAPGLQVWAERF